MAAPQVSRPYDPLSATGADAPGIGAGYLQHRELATLATDDHAIHLYTCGILRKTVFTATTDADTIQQTGHFPHNAKQEKTRNDTIRQRLPRRDAMPPTLRDTAT